MQRACGKVSQLVDGRKMKRHVRGEEWSTLEGRSTGSLSNGRQMYFTPAYWLTDYRQLRINRLAISDTWRRHRDTDSIPAKLKPLTAQLEGAIILQKLTVTYTVKTLPIFNGTRKFSTVTFRVSSASSISNIFTTWYVTYFLVTKYLHQ